MIRPRLQFSFRTFVLAVTAASIWVAFNRDWLVSYFESPGRDVPADFAFSPDYIRWSTPVGSVAHGSPVIADGRIYVGTNNRGGSLDRCPPSDDMGVLMCLDQSSGKMLWQANTWNHEQRSFSWPFKGQRGKPVIEKDRLWYIDRRHDLVCLDTEGFYDDEDDGLICSLDPKWDRTKEADVVWRFDMVKELGITPKDMCYVDRSNSVCQFGGVLLCVTGHCHLGRVDVAEGTAPSFIAVDKHSGKLIWHDSSASAGSLDTQTGTPVCASLGGVTQAIFPGGDGWLYSFDFKSLAKGKTKLLWKFDCNPKDSSWLRDSKIWRMALLSQPVIDNGLVYVATATFDGGDMVPGQIWCVDPNGRGDVSPNLVFNKADPTIPIADKLPSACDPLVGDVIKPNPNSAAVWNYVGDVLSRPSAIGMNSCRNKLSIQDGLLVATDDAGFVHCLDAKTGERFWAYDLLDTGTGSAVFSDQHIHITHDSGMTVFAFSKDKQIAIPAAGPHSVLCPQSIAATPVIEDDTLYVLTDGFLHAISETQEDSDQ